MVRKIKPLILVTFFLVSCKQSNKMQENSHDINSKENENKVMYLSINENSSITKISGQVFCKGYSDSFLLVESDTIKYFKNTPCKIRLDRVELNDGTVYQNNSSVSLLKFNISFEDLKYPSNYIIDTFEHNTGKIPKILDKTDNKLRLQKVKECNLVETIFKSWSCKGTDEEAFFSLKSLNGILSIEIQKINRAKKDIEIISGESIKVESHFSNENAEDTEAAKILKSSINETTYYTFQSPTSINFAYAYYLLCPIEIANLNQNITSIKNDNLIEEFSNGCFRVEDGFDLTVYLKSKRNYILLSTKNRDMTFEYIDSKTIYGWKYEFPFLKYSLPLIEKQKTL